MVILFVNQTSLATVFVIYYFPTLSLYPVDTFGDVTSANGENSNPILLLVLFWKSTSGFILQKKYRVILTFKLKSTSLVKYYRLHSTDYCRDKAVSRHVHPMTSMTSDVRLLHLYMSSTCTGPIPSHPYVFINPTVLLNFIFRPSALLVTYSWRCFSCSGGHL